MEEVHRRIVKRGEEDKKREKGRGGREGRGDKAAHFKKLGGLLHSSVPPGTGGWVSTSHLTLSLMADVGLGACDELLGQGVELRVVVGGKGDFVRLEA